GAVRLEAQQHPRKRKPKTPRKQRDGPAGGLHEIKVSTLQMLVGGGVPVPMSGLVAHLMGLTAKDIRDAHARCLAAAHELAQPPGAAGTRDIAKILMQGGDKDDGNLRKEVRRLQRNPLRQVVVSAIREEMDKRSPNTEARKRP